MDTNKNHATMDVQNGVLDACVCNAKQPYISRWVAVLLWRNRKFFLAALRQCEEQEKRHWIIFELIPPSFDSRILIK